MPRMNSKQRNKIYMCKRFTVQEHETTYKFHKRYLNIACKILLTEVRCKLNNIIYINAIYVFRELLHSLC